MLCRNRSVWTKTEMTRSKKKKKVTVNISYKIVESLHACLILGYIYTTNKSNTSLAPIILEAS